MTDRNVTRDELLSLLGCTSRRLTAWVAAGRIPPPDVPINLRAKIWRASTLREKGIVVPEDRPRLDEIKR